MLIFPVFLLSLQASFLVFLAVFWCVPLFPLVLSVHFGCAVGREHSDPRDHPTSVEADPIQFC